MESQEIKKIANLAKLIINKDEEVGFANKLKSVMNMINQLKDINCSNITPLSSICDMNLRMREDIVNDGNKEGEILFNAPGEVSGLAKRTHFFVVPKVIE
jgi:aspartyl-tRNA(Asn)/glutamyl-tRNA(Gln) amidotransferase subunit C